MEFILEQEQELTLDMLADFIKRHEASKARYKRLGNLYKGKHAILDQEKKDGAKPDNRLVVNYAKYITDVFNGFFIGKPIKVTHPQTQTEEEINYINRLNRIEDHNAELSKLMSIYGKAYELLYVDEDLNLGITYLDPTQAFLIKDNSIRERTRYGVRYFLNSKEELEGTYSDGTTIYYFRENKDGLTVTEERAHSFNGVPFVEYVENEEKQAIFENVETLINAYNKAISEKANDVDYFADAYLKIIGAELDERTIKELRRNRIINIPTVDGEPVEISFLDKPNSDTTQENLINRLEKLIFQISMVSNINDENFGNASGISLKYKLQSMLNLAAAKERKFTAGLQERYRLIATSLVSKLKEDDWIELDYHYTRNVPNNQIEEAEIATKLQGITSQETYLKVLSLVDNVAEEKEKIMEEEEERFNAINKSEDYVVEEGEIDDEERK